jgi:RNA polymerase sigma-70 factor (ECF subfamily)
VSSPPSDAGRRGRIPALASDPQVRWFVTEFQAAARTLWLIAVGVVRDAATAEDVVQEAAVIALEKLDQFRPETNFTAWCGQIVRNVALNRARKERKRRVVPLDPALMEGTPAVTPDGRGGVGPRVGPRGQLSQDQSCFDDRVMQALNGLSEMARACLLLRTVEEMEYSRISALLGIPEGTAMSHVHRARVYLRERLMDYGPGTDGREESTP